MYVHFSFFSQVKAHEVEFWDYKKLSANTCSMLVCLRLFSDLKFSLNCINRKLKKGFLFLFETIARKRKTHLFNNDLSKRNSAKISISLGDCPMKNSWIFFRKLELLVKPLRRPILAWLQFYLTPKRYHLKRYQLEPATV